MKVKAEASKEESKLQESSLNDLPVADEQVDETKGGNGYRKEIQIESWSIGSTNSGSF
jgi:hypothetical protein